MNNAKSRIHETDSWKEDEGKHARLSERQKERKRRGRNEVEGRHRQGEKKEGTLWQSQIIRRAKISNPS